MKKHRLKKKFVVLFILMVLLGFSVYKFSSHLKLKADNKVVAKKDTEVKDDAAEVEEVATFLKPHQSQQINQFPWDLDADFLAAQKNHDTEVLIAGYVTVFNGFSDPDIANIKHATELISEMVLAPNDVFSQNNTVGPYSEANGYFKGEGYFNGEVVLVLGGGVCNVSTTLFNTAILSDLEIVERYNHSMPVDYVPYGQDAAVVENVKDFKFRNNTDDNLLIWAKLMDERLYMAFYGQKAAPKVEWEHEVVSTTKAAVQYKINPDLAAKEENVLVKGMDGKVVNSVVKVTYADGETIIRDLGTTYYNPLTHLIEKRSLDD